MATAKKKTYVVQRRYWVWAERKILAESMEDACEQLSELFAKDFVTAADGAEINDVEIMPGEGVREDW